MSTSVALSRAESTSAAALWSAAKPAAGTVAGCWLARHGIAPPPPPSIRFCPRFPIFGRPYQYSQALLAAVQAQDRTITAVEVWYLKETSRRDVAISAPPQVIGDLSDGAVRFARAAETILLGSDLLQTLAAGQHFGVAAWAALYPARFASVALPPEATRVLLAVENDREVIALAERAATHIHARGLEVEIAIPPDNGMSWDEYILARAVAQHED